MIKTRSLLKNTREGLLEENAKYLYETFGPNQLDIKNLSIMKIIANILYHPIVAFEILSLFFLKSLNYELYFTFLLAYLCFNFFVEITKKL